MKTSIKDLPESLVRIMSKGLTPMIHGSPGTSKSDSVKQVAEKYNLKLIDVRLAQCAPEDLLGLPFRDGNKASYLPIDTFPLATDPIPKGYKGWLIFLDEFNSAPISVQGAAYKVVLDRMIGLHHIHPAAMMCGAGNLVTDKAIVNKMSTAMQSRLVHLEVFLDSETWVNWANNNEIDHRVISFINFRPKLLNNFKPTHSDYTFANARTWEFASKLIKGRDKLDHIDTTILAGTLGDGVAREFNAFTSLFGKLYSIDEILKNPEHIEMPTEPSVIYAYTGMLSEHINIGNIGKLLKFITRMPIEMMLVTMIPALKRHPELDNDPDVVQFKVENISQLV